MTRRPEVLGSDPLDHLQPGMDSLDAACVESEALLLRLETSGPDLAKAVPDAELVYTLCHRVIDDWVVGARALPHESEGLHAAGLRELAEAFVQGGELARALRGAQRLHRTLVALGAAPASERRLARLVELLQDACWNVELAAPGGSPGVGERAPGIVAGALVNRAVGALPAQHQDRYRDEWRNELWELPRRQRVPYALRLLRQTRGMRRALAFVPADGLERRDPWSRS